MFSKKFLYFVVLSEGDTLSQNKVSISESKILVGKRMIPKIIQDSYVIAKFSGISTFKKLNTRDEKEENKTSL